MEAAVRRSRALRIALYLRESVRLRRRRALSSAEWLTLMRRFPEWQASLGEGRGPLSDERPWFNFEAIEFVDRRLERGMRVFEYGSGGSTLFYAGRTAGGCSVEHDPAWYEVVAQAVRGQGLEDVWSVILQVPGAASGGGDDPADPHAYRSADLALRERGFQAYAAIIDRFEDEAFDLVSVDGRARPSCALHARRKIRHGGYLLLDNSDRAHYHQIHAMLDGDGWTRHHFEGPVPSNFEFCSTTIWRRP
jgi:hypothetical protein